MSEKPLVVIPTYLRKSPELMLTGKCLRTLRETIGDRADVLVVDDGSPARDLVEGGLQGTCELYDAELVMKSENEGFSRTVNVGLQRALDEGRDAILVNNDVEFGLTKDWLTLMQSQQRSDGKYPASIVGALLLYPNGLIQHGGIFFSLLRREFDHRFRFGPGNLPEAQHAVPCPVTGALMFIRHECLEGVGLYDESFRLGWEDVSYCIDTVLADRESVYQPGVRAIHHESFTRGQGGDAKIQQWTEYSWLRFCAKHANTNFASFVPTTMSMR